MCFVLFYCCLVVCFSPPEVHPQRYIHIGLRVKSLFSVENAPSFVSGAEFPSLPTPLPPPYTSQTACRLSAFFPSHPSLCFVLSLSIYLSDSLSPLYISSFFFLSSRNQFPPFFTVLRCSLGRGELQACPFPDVVFPPLPLSALPSSPFHCILQDGFGQT